MKVKANTSNTVRREGKQGGREAARKNTANNITKERENTYVHKERKRRKRWKRKGKQTLVEKEGREIHEDDLPPRPKTWPR